MKTIADKLRASIKYDAINGDTFERSICGRQMLEAAEKIEKLIKENSDLKEKSAEWLAEYFPEDISSYDCK